MENCPELRKDVLQELMESLPLSDYIRFGAINPSWSAVAKKKQMRKVPLLVFKEDMDKDTTSFFNVFNKKLYHTDQVQELRGRSFCGSSYGWLITVDINLDMYLLNPFTRAQIKLPKLHPTFLQRMHLHLYPEAARNQLIRKVVLTADPGKTSDYLVIATFDDQFSLGFWRPGDLNWTVKRTNKSLPIIDVIWYKESIYIVSSKVYVEQSRPGVFTGVRYLTGSIYIVDFNLNIVEEVVPFRINKNRGISFKQYLVENMSGDLFIVTRKLARQFGTPRLPKRKITVGFEVFKIDQSGLQMQIVPCESIGEHVFFVGCNNSIVVSTADMDEQEGDLIYFTDVGFDTAVINRGYIDMGVYNMKVRRKYYLPVDESFKYPPVFVEANP